MPSAHLCSTTTPAHARTLDCPIGSRGRLSGNDDRRYARRVAAALGGVHAYWFAGPGIMLRFGLRPLGLKREASAANSSPSRPADACRTPTCHGATRANALASRTTGLTPTGVAKLTTSRLDVAVVRMWDI